MTILKHVSKQINNLPKWTSIRQFSISRLLFSKDDEYKEVQTPPPQDPFKRTFNILKHDLKSIVDPNIKPLLEFPTHVDIVIIGGGIMGSAIAYSIKSRIPITEHKTLDVVVIERDLAYTRASTVLSVGGLRQQFSLKENIQMSMYSADFLRKAPELLKIEDSPAPDMHFNPYGYLFLATEKGAPQLLENYALQTEVGAKVEILSKTKLAERYPWMKTDDLEMGCLGLENEGWFDPWALLYGYKRKNIALGVHYVKADVVGFDFKPGVAGFTSGLDVGEPINRINKVLVKTDSGEIKSINYAYSILAAGYESGRVAEMARIGRGEGILSVPLPVEPRKRYVYHYHSPDGPSLDCPLVIDPSGAYFRRESLAGHYLAGQSPPLEDEPNVENLDVDYSYFDTTVWPNIANRVPSFNNLKVKSAWAGYYDYNSFDQNGIIGCHPYYTNMIIATGFSGHGIQQAPAVGRAVAELVLDSKFMTIDLTKFGFERLLVGTELKEKNIV